METMSENQFPKELNDISIKGMTIDFTLTAAQVLGNLTLFLDAPNVTHDTISGCNFRTSVNL